MNRRRSGAFRGALVLAMLPWAVPATGHADEGPSALVASSGPGASSSESTPDGTAGDATRLPLWSMPRRARLAVRRIAAEQDARITRCQVTEQGGQTIYEIYGTRRTDLIRRSEFLLARHAEPGTGAADRLRERSLGGRLGRLRDALRLPSWPMRP